MSWRTVSEGRVGLFHITRGVPYAFDRCVFDGTMEDDLYGLLELNFDDHPTEQDIKKAYKVQALRWHPDKVQKSISGDQEAVSHANRRFRWGMTFSRTKRAGSSGICVSRGSAESVKTLNFEIELYYVSG